MANPIIDQMKGAQIPQTPQIPQQNNVMSIIMQGIGAMFRGETPQQFLQNLAKTNPQLKGLDLDHPYQTSEQLYRDKGEDIGAAKNSIMDKINQFIANK